MTEEETLCNFMEEKPGYPGTVSSASPRRWWRWQWKSKTSGQWGPISLTLNECREIESKLDGEQWELYREALSIPYIRSCPSLNDLIHFEVAEKIKALAAVLRG